MNIREINSYEEFKEQKVQLYAIIKFHLEILLGSLNRKITFRQKFKNPWSASSSLFVQRDVFFYCYRAIRDHNISFGRTIENIKDKKGFVKSFTIKFVHLGTLKYHLSKVVNKKNLNKIFNKAQKNGCTANIDISESKPYKLLSLIFT